MAALGRKDIKIGVDVDRSSIRDLNNTTRAATGAGGAVGGLGKSLRKTGGEFLSFKSRIPVLQLGLMGTAAYNAAGGVVSLASALAPLSGLLGAVGPLATTAAQAKLTLGLATADLEQAVGGLNEQLDEESAAFKKLSPEGKKFARTLQGMKPAFRSLQNAAQQGLFPGLEKGIESAVRNLPKLRKVVRGTAEAFGDLAEQAGRRLGSEEWGRDLQTQGGRNELTLRRLGDSGLDLAEAFKDVTLAAGPLVDRLTRWVGALTEGWKQSANAARESGRLERFFKDAGDTFFKTVRILRDLTVAFVNIGRAARQAFGNELLSGIERGAAGLRKWTESARGQRELVAIFTDIGERLKRVGGFIKDLFGDFRQMRSEGKSAGDALGQVFLTAISKVIENAGELGVKFAKAFVRGFIDADVGGKLILAAFTLSKFGLLGKTVGAIFGVGMAKGAAAGVVGSGAGAAGGGLLATLRTTLLANAKRIGLVGVGALLAKDVLDEFGRKAREGGPDAFQALADAKGHEGGFVGSFMSLTQSVTGKVPGLKNWDNRVFNDTELSAKKLLPLLEKLKATSAQIDSESARKLREEIGKLSGVSDEAKEGLRGIVDRAAEIADTSARLSVKFDASTPISAIRRVSNAFDDLRSHTTASLATTARIADRNMRLIARSLGTNSKAGQQALRENFRLAANDIRDLVDSGLTTASRGSAAIRKTFLKYLGTFGLKGSAAKFYLEQGPRGAGFIAGSKQEPISGHRQTGGMVVPGSGSGDKVKLTAMVEPGEKVFVLNRNASKHLDDLHSLNAQVPRFQKGGEMGGIPHLATGGGLQPGVSGLLKKLLDKFPGLSVTSTTGGNHAANSLHYTGQAVDVASGNYPYMNQAAGWLRKKATSSLAEGIHNPNLSVDSGHAVSPSFWGADTWAGHLNHIHMAVTGALGALAAIKVPKIPFQNVKGAGALGAVGGGVQSGLNSVRNVAQAALKQAASMSAPDEKFSGSLGALSKGQIKNFWVGAGGDPGIANLMAAIAMAESGGRVDAVGNDPGGTRGLGLWQITTGFNTDLIAKYGGERAMLGSGLANAKAALEIFNRQGLGAWVVYNTGAYQQFLKRGGQVDDYAKGGLVGMVGDSLGVGTQGPLGGRLHGQLRADNVGGRRSGPSLAPLKKFLGKGFKKYVLDFGTNDNTAGEFRGSISAANKMTGDRPLVIPTINGPEAEAKNKMLHALGHRDINLVEWAKRSEGLLSSDGIHATGAGYAKRAGMIAGVLAQVGGDDDGDGGGGKPLGPLAKSLPKALRQTLKRVTKGATKAKRSKALDAFKKKIGKLGLPSKLQGDINAQIEQHNQFSEFASRASGLAGEDERTSVATLAKVGGLNEGGWLVKDLSVLTKLRNNLLRVRKIILERKAKIEAALKLAQKRLKELSKKGTTPRKWKGLNPAKDSIAKWNKQPTEKRKKRMQEWHQGHGSLPGDREFTKDGKLLVGPGRRRMALQGMVTALKTQRGRLLNGQESGLGDNTSGVLGSLFDVQGYATGDPYKRYPTLPPIGTLGGWIGDTQTALRALGESLKPQTDSSAGSDLFDSGRADRLAELLGLERQRALVRDIEVAELLRSARMPPFAGVFHQGGTVPGPVGADRLILAQGGEVVSTAEQAGRGTPVLNVTFADGMGWLRKFVKVEVDHTLHRESRSVGRVPGIPT